MTDGPSFKYWWRMTRKVVLWTIIGLLVCIAGCCVLGIVGSTL